MSQARRRTSTSSRSCYVECCTWKQGRVFKTLPQDKPSLRQKANGFDTARPAQKEPNTSPSVSRPSHQMRLTGIRSSTVSNGRASGSARHSSGAGKCRVRKCTLASHRTSACRHVGRKCGWQARYDHTVMAMTRHTGVVYVPLLLQIWKSEAERLAETGHAVDCMFSTYLWLVAANASRLP